MLRGYRLFFAAFVGLALVGASQPPKDAGKPKEGQTQGSVSKPPAIASTTPPEATKAIEPPEYYQPCEQSRNKGRSDLCAQWSAAKAAKEAADWAWLQLWLSGMGVVGLGVTLWFNLQAWRQAAASRIETETALKHAGRSANAMAKVAKTLQDQATLVAKAAATNKRIADAQQTFSVMQMRAYLSVVVGLAIYQDRANGLSFEAKPQIINSGNTAASDLSYRIKAEILPFPLPPNHQWRPAPDAGAQGFIPPQQHRLMSAVVDQIVPDSEVGKVMVRDGLGLYVWGTVSYKDVFKIERETNFGLSIFWLISGNGDHTIMAEYLPGMNDGT